MESPQNPLKNSLKMNFSSLLFCSVVYFSVMKVSIIGTGRVGLVLGLSMARGGHKVFFTDRDKKKLKSLSRGVFPFYEPHLKETFHKAKTNCQWNSSFEEIRASSFLFLTLSAPLKAQGELDISGVLNWAETLSTQVKEEKILILKSTLTPGTNQAVQNIIQKNKAPVHVITCPEFLRQGEAFKDVHRPARIVIGCRNQKAGKKLGEFYKTFSKGKILYTTPETAELGKLVCNSYMGLKVSFINEMSLLTSYFKGDMEDLKRIMGTDHRINSEFLQPGLGFGGSCLSKDIEHLIYKSRTKGLSLKMLKAILQINQKRGLHFFHQIKKHFKKLKGRTLVVWGLSFKKNTDDFTQSPAVFLAKKLMEEGVLLKVYDPLIPKQGNKKTLYHKIFGNHPSFSQKKVIFCSSPKTSLKETEGLILGTEEVPQIPLKEIKKHLSFIVDGRGVFRKKDLQKHGFIFYQAGSSFL